MYYDETAQLSIKLDARGAEGTNSARDGKSG